MYLTVKSKKGVPYREDQKQVYLTVKTKKDVPYREERFLWGGGRGGGGGIATISQFFNPTISSSFLEYFILIGLDK